ncbi:MAG: hypothetical protein ACLUD2_14110 [Clostridium sp.]
MSAIPVRELQAGGAPGGLRGAAKAGWPGGADRARAAETFGEEVDFAPLNKPVGNYP